MNVALQSGSTIMQQVIVSKLYKCGCFSLHILDLTCVERIKPYLYVSLFIFINQITCSKFI